MISKSKFKELIEEYYEQDELVDKLDNIFRNSFDNFIIDWGFKMFDMLLRCSFNEEGYDWISYFLYENPEKCYYKDNKRIPLETVDQLWNLVKNCRKK